MNRQVIQVLHLVNLVDQACGQLQRILFCTTVCQLLLNISALYVALTGNYDERCPTYEVLEAYFRELRSQPSEIDRHRIEHNN